MSERLRTRRARDACKEGERFLVQGELASARAAFERGLVAARPGPSSSRDTLQALTRRALLGLGRVDLARGDERAAGRRLAECADCPEPSTADGATPPSAILLAACWEANDGFEEALGAYEAACSANGGSMAGLGVPPDRIARTAVRAAATRLAAGADPPLEAIAAVIRRGCALAPGVARLHYLLGRVLLESQRSEESAEHLRTALELEPDLARARIALDQVLGRRASERAALARFQSLIAEARRTPTDVSLLHAVFLAALDVIEDGARTDEPASWAIGCFGALFAADDYWESWLAAARARHGQPEAAPIDKNVFLETLARRWIALLQTCVRGHPTVGWDGACLSELAGARALRAAGGISCDGAGRRASFGPVLLRLLALEDELSGLIAALDVKCADDLLDSFDAFAPARTLLAAGRSEEARDALLERACVDCGQTNWDVGIPSSCRADCRAFERANPILARVPRAREVHAERARKLLADVEMKCASRAMERARAARAWDHALALARALGKGEEAAAHMAQSVARIADELCRSERIDEAVELLEERRRAVAGEIANLIDGRLAIALALRGERRRKSERVAEAVADLRRAVDLAPHVDDYVADLSLALRSSALAHFDFGRLDDACRLAEEALEVLEDRRASHRHHAGIEYQLGRARPRLSKLTTDCARILYERGERDRAREIVERALTRLPGDERLLRIRAEWAERPAEGS